MSAVGLRRLSPVLTLLNTPGFDLEGINTHELPDGAICYCAETKCDFQLDLTSTAAAVVGAVVVPLSGPGRWKSAAPSVQGSSTVFRRSDFTPLTTPSNVQATLFSFALDAYQDGTYDLGILVQLRNEATGDTASYRRVATFKVVAGVVTQVSTTDATYDKVDAALAACVVTIDTSGGDARVQVTGLLATPLTWTGGYESALTLY
jgi:hypothetical protein